MSLVSSVCHGLMPVVVVVGVYDVVEVHFHGIDCHTIRFFIYVLLKYYLLSINVTDLHPL